MQYRTLGRTGLQVSVIALGAGPVSGLMTGRDSERQIAVLRRATELGVNWIDTAAGYGQGQSEASLGAALRWLEAHAAELAGAQGRDAEPTSVQACRSPNAPRLHLATKVRISPEGCRQPADEVRRSFESSLQRLQVDRVTLLQVHNAVTPGPGEEAASITPHDLLRPGGILDAFERLHDERLIDFIGLTGTGHPDSLRLVLDSGRIDTVQVPFHLLNPSAGRHMPPRFAETDYGNLFEACRARQIGVFAIRVFAAGALLGNPPSAHTRVTPFFPLALYERDCRRARAVSNELGGASLKELAVRYALSHPAVASAIIGFGSPEELNEIAALAAAGPLEPGRAAEIDELVDRIAAADA